MYRHTFDYQTGRQTSFVVRLERKQYDLVADDVNKFLVEGENDFCSS